MGSGLSSLVPTYAKVCASMLATALGDSGRLNILSRAVMASQLQKAKTGSMENPAASWQSQSSHMRLRQLAIMHSMDLKLACDLQAPIMQGCHTLHDLLSCMVGFRPEPVDYQLIKDQILHPLWRQGVHSLQGLLDVHGFKELADVQQQRADWHTSAVRALCLLLHICCTVGRDFAIWCENEGVAPPPPSCSLLLPPAYRHSLQPPGYEWMLASVECFDATLQSHNMHACFRACTDLLPEQRAVRNLTPNNPDTSWPWQAGASAEFQVDPIISASLWPSKVACAAAQSLLRDFNVGE